MVRGIEKFKEFFENYENNYVLIGGTACSIIFDEVGIDFRATKDLDIVLIIENLNDEFATKLWHFIKAAGYQIGEGKDKKFYRFDKPQDASYPKMIELFSRSTGISLIKDSHLEPLHISDDVSSLSAILLNDDYYNLLIEGKRMSEGYSVLDERYLIPFKTKAWCEMIDRQSKGEEGLSKHIKKHFRDVYMLLSIIPQDERIKLTGTVYNDMERFINNILISDNRSEDIDYQRMHDLLRRIYLTY